MEFVSVYWIDLRNEFIFLFIDGSIHPKNRMTETALQSFRHVFSGILHQPTKQINLFLII
jgi:hypothetical protein